LNDLNRQKLAMPAELSAGFLFLVRLMLILAVGGTVDLPGL
jgi:hypothetical protein